MSAPVGKSARLFKPAPPHNRLASGPATCGCVECCRKVLALRCEAVSRDGDRCGDYKRHRGHHSMIVPTDFLMAEERIRLDAPPVAPSGSQIEDAG